ncbi:MAG: SbcC/MukB-like Walker B domain-containing protein [Spirochaetia bacterium]|nr:SbcC/MukB-like Walker B domain-containing protein [Spirochaetia bacterium]
MLNELELADGQSGFRLDTVELYNWGTFGNAVWTFPFCGQDSLVTGDIGSGKSTWVDALSTLLVPPHRITYNKAAGAERRERTDKSYVLGEYRSSRDEGASYAKAVNIRDESCYSVILAVFVDARSSRLLSLAQVRWMKAGEVQRVYTTSGRRLSVLVDFRDFDGDGAKLRKRLRAEPNTEAFDTFSDYSSAFRSAMGISEKALDLFNQTVSMKTIGDLDDFIRDHMLEPSGAADRIDEILKNFDNLRAAHDSVESSRRQRDALVPIRDEGKEHTELASVLDVVKSMTQALPYYSLSRAIPLLTRERDRLGLELDSTRTSIEGIDTSLGQRREDQARIRSAIDNSEAGRRIVELEADMARAGEERDRRRAQASRYGEIVARLGKSSPKDADSFVSLRAALRTSLAGVDDERSGLSTARDAHVIERRERNNGLGEIRSELESLRKRTTSIPANVATIRRALAEALGTDEAALPFAGELIRVANKERSWEGAAERILRSFALSVLVPEKHYRALSEYVKATRLTGKLVYFRVPESAGQVSKLSSSSLARVFEIKPDAPFRVWLEAEIARRADYTRCSLMEDFYREPDAVTVEGLIKSGKIRHEKDDRRSVADPRNYVLGWSNAEKIALLEQDEAKASRALEESIRAIVLADKTIAALEARKTDMVEALRFELFDDIDVARAVVRYETLRSEREALERSSDQLSGLKASLDAVTKTIASLEQESGRLREKAGGLKTLKETREAELEAANTNLAAAKDVDWSPLFLRLDDFTSSGSPGLDDLAGWQTAVRQRLDAKGNTLARKDSELRSSLQHRMHLFVTAFPERSAELSATIDYLPDYLALLERIEHDDLPSFESRFRALLRESTLRDIALFQTELENDAQAIRSSIDTINKSLESIEYDKGTYITLAAERREDQAVHDFRTEMRRCLENTLGDDELYSEEKFLRVKNLLTRFAGSEPVDRAWTAHVTDARAWFTFTASERWKEDGSEKEFYSSSSGKSGGQKEKLAYTILASALAYQYGQGTRRSPGGFRLVVIDEAFGRGSEESTRYGLRLFSSLDLQLILVTPLQKIGVIEGSVSTIHLIANPLGSASEVRSLGISEYEEEKAAWAEPNSRAEPKKE